MLNITRSGKITSWSHAVHVIATGILSGLLVIFNYDCLQTYITPSVSPLIVQSVVSANNMNPIILQDKNLRSTLLWALW